MRTSFADVLRQDPGARATGLEGGTAQAGQPGTSHAFRPLRGSGREQGEVFAPEPLDERPVEVEMKGRDAKGSSFAPEREISTEGALWMCVSGMTAFVPGAAEALKQEGSARAAGTTHWERMFAAQAQAQIQGEAGVREHRVLLGHAPGQGGITSEARVSFFSGPLAGAQVRLQAEGQRVSLALVTEGAGSGQVLGQAVRETARRLERRGIRLIASDLRGSAGTRGLPDYSARTIAGTAAQGSENE